MSKSVKRAVDRQGLIAAVSRYARGVRGQVTIRQFCKAAGVAEGKVHEQFPGGIRELLRAAGMAHRATRRELLTFGRLMTEIDEVAKSVGRVPTAQDVDREGKVTSRTYYDRLGSWEKVREAYVKWLKERGRNIATAPHLHIATSEGIAREVGGPRGRGRSAAVRGTAIRCRGKRATGERRRWGRRGPSARNPGRWHGRKVIEAAGVGLVGKPLNFPGMLFAPVCESGVVYLFGLVARELGYSVEQIGTAFPDCLALERLEGKGERWRRVRVEFEHRSSNFRAHGHDIAGCDVIVCWENDWKDCPVEVVELKSKVEELRRAA